MYCAEQGEWPPRHASVPVKIRSMGLTHPLLPILPPIPVFTESTTTFLRNMKIDGSQRRANQVLDERCEISSNEDRQTNTDQLIVAQENVFIVWISFLEMRLDVIHPSSSIDRAEQNNDAFIDSGDNRSYLCQTMLVADRSQIS